MVRFLRYHGEDVRRRPDGSLVVYKERRCTYLMSKGCAIYSERPLICREYVCEDAKAEEESCS